MYSSDQDILAFMRKDKTIGIQHLFDRYYRPLVLFADEFLKDSSAAEDLVQDFFVKLWEDDYLLKVAEGVSWFLSLFCGKESGNFFSSEKRCITRFSRIGSDRYLCRRGRGY